MLIDPYGRELGGLRVSLTHRCNLNCFFCHNEGCRSGAEMDASEMALMLRRFRVLGFGEVKFTGGEPMLRGDAESIMESANALGYRTSVTTNGTLRIPKNVDSVNISLHSLKRDVYERITGHGTLRKATEAVKRCDAPSKKTNAVMLKGINDAEVPAMLEFALANGANLQLIELTPFDGARGAHMPLDGIEKALAENANRVETRALHNRRRYWFDGHYAEVVTRSAALCAGCTRLRVTADGAIKPCLMSETALSIRGALGDAQAFERRVREAVSLRAPYYR